MTSNTIVLGLGVAATIGVSAALGVQGPSTTPGHGSPVSPQRIRADVEFLADDLLEGRETGTRGYDLAALYVATALKSAGYAPAADDGTYFQRVPLLEITRTAASMRLTIDGTTSDVPLPAEGGVSANASTPTSEVTAPVVFAGFGVTAPEFGHDDYAGLDVKGKIVAVITNAPAKFPSEPRAYYASGEQKHRTAADRGAVGVVHLVGPDDLKRNSWERMTAAYGRPSMTWVDPEGRPGNAEKRLRAVGYLNPAGGARLFAGAPLSFDQAVEAGRKGEAGGRPLAASLTMSSSASQKRLTSPNVVAVLKGSDPELARTSVVLTAHLDHTGVEPAAQGDRINNGAYDNAMGSGIVLEVARALANAPERPKRSVIVALVTAEEKGLLGSDYFARHPVKAAGRIVANINLDMPVFLTDSRDIIAFGSENSTLDAVVRRAVGAAGYTLRPDPLPEENIFIRSDQYSLVKQGVPALMLAPGFTATDPAVNGQQLFGQFLASHYHRPTDDLSLPMDLGAVARFAAANLAIARAIADDPIEPSWKPGNFFGRIFAKDAARSGSR